MDKLIFSIGDLVLKDIPFDRPRLSIGRLPDNDVQIDSPAVAATQAVIIRDGAGIRLENLSTQMPTLVNGLPGERQPLTAGDVVAIGPYRLRLSSGEDAGAAGLLLLDGPRSGTVLPLNKETTRLGKVGAQVATITRRADGYRLATVDGEKPPKLNGRILAGHGAAIQDGDIVEIAGVRMQFVAQSEGRS